MKFQAPKGFTVVLPKDLDEACRIQASEKTRCKLVAGGTDVLAQWAAGVPMPARVLSLWNLEGLVGIEVGKDGLVEIGAATTHAAIYGHPGLKARLPALVAACSSVGATQIQQRGTLGGNAANASPAGDTGPALLVTDGCVLFASAKGLRTVPIAEFWTGYRQIAARPDEIVATFLLPSKGGAREGFRKIGTRRAQAISKIMAAYRIAVRKNVVERAALALGSVAAVPVRLPDVERFLLGQTVTPGLADAAAKLAFDSVQPISDIRSSADYRRHAAASLVRSIVASLAQ